MSLRKSLFVAEVGMFYVYISEPRGYGANLYGFTYPQRLPFMVRRHGGKIKPMGVYYENQIIRHNFGWFNHWLRQ